MGNNETQALENLLLNIDIFKKLDQWQINEINIFEVLGIVRQEIKHNNFLAWVFDANENHGLHDNFVKRFLLKTLTQTSNKTDLNIFDISLMDYESFIVKREWEYIDILLVSETEKVVIAIENKIYAGESPTQLNDYKEILDSNFPEFKKLRIFLTRNGITASDVINWVSAKYQWVLDSLSEALDNDMNISTESKMLITNYITMVRRNLIMDKELREVCWKIYNQHKEAFKLIYSVTQNYLNEYFDYIIEWLNDNAAVYSITFNPDYSKNFIIRFTTPIIERNIPKNNTNDFGWKNGYRFMYEIKVERESIYLVGSTSTQNEDITIKLLEIAKKHFKPDFVNSIWAIVYREPELLNKEEIEKGVIFNENRLDELLHTIFREYIPKYEKILEDELPIEI